MLGRTTSSAIRNVDAFDLVGGGGFFPQGKHPNFSPFLCLPTPAVLLPFGFPF